MAVYQKKQDGKVVGYYYSVYYKDVYGNQKRKKSKVFDKKKDCQYAEQQFLNEASKGIDVSTLNSIIEIYLSEKKKRWNERTYYDTECLIKKHITPTFGNMKWQSITPIMCKTWFDNIEGCQAARKNKIKREFSQIFKYCKMYTGVDYNPLDALEYEQTETNESILSHIWTVDEFNIFLDHVEDYELKTIYYVFFWTGMRFGELRGLSPSSINFEKRYISITEQVPSKTLDGNNSRVKLKTKTSKRKIYFNQETEQVLKDYIEYIKQFAEYNDDCFLFGLNKPYSAKKIRTHFHTITEQIGLKSIVIHDLRHCRASYLICNGYNIMFVCSQLGHKKPSMTLDVYSELMEDLNNAEANRLYQG